MSARKPAAAASRVPRGLEAYNARRRFDRTAEPRGRRSTAASRSGSRRPLRFVVQRHDARRLHFDFRLELDGVLLSWAVPKGPSLSPADRRLAVQTEDHPLEYRNFEGRIAAGEYGAGTVIVWDQGHWFPQGDPHEGLRRGRLQFSLRGDKLQGGFSLVRMHGEPAAGAKHPWLLIKRADAAAREGAAARVTERLQGSVLRSSGGSGVRDGTRRVRQSRLPQRLAPQLATTVDHPPQSGPWVYEIKFDGYRMLARLESGGVQLLSRNGQDWTSRLPAIAAALRSLEAEGSCIDGEVCHVDDRGLTHFEGLQDALGTRGQGPGVQDSPAQARLKYFVFDLLFDHGQDLRDQPLLTRKRRLQALLGRRIPPQLVYSQDLQAEGRIALAQACAAGLEGLIAKRADAPYRAGRSTRWLKLKCRRRQEFAIVGLTAPQGGRTGFGALLLAVRDAGRWIYRGKVGTGFSAQMLARLNRRLRPHHLSRPVLEKAPRMNDVTWLKPVLACEVEFTGLTREGRLRHPSFVGLREDKAAAEITDEVRVSATELEEGEGADVLEIEGQRITHPRRQIDSRSGVSKGELARYLHAVGPLLMPYARGRPLALVRCPQGDPDACFFQKHKGAGMGRAVHRARREGQEVLYIDDPSGLLQLAQFSVVELHAWGARVDDAGRPDWLVLDLDPDVSLQFADVVSAALEIRELLTRIGLKSFVKTTGGKGLHLVVPLQPQASWEQVREFTKVLARQLASAAPQRYVASLSKARRQGRIFIDYLRNAAGATAVLPYSPRMRPALTVAMPLDWKQLTRVRPDELTVRSVPRWLARRRKDPWADFFDIRQALPAIERLRI